MKSLIAFLTAITFTACVYPQSQNVTVIPSPGSGGMNTGTFSTQGINYYLGKTGTTWDFSQVTLILPSSLAFVSTITAGAGINVSQSTGAVTISNTGVLAITPGSGITESIVGGTVTLNNSGVLAITAGNGISVSGTQANITINATSSSSGTVTSVSGTGSVNGITLTGNVTTSGNLTLGGTLSGISNSQLTNNSITIAGTATALGSSITQDTITGLSTTGIVKRTGANTLAIATSSTDYAPATTGNSAQLLANNGTGGFSNVIVGSGLSLSAGTLTSTSGGSGTVTSVSTGNLSPIFTTSVATATTTPNITFSLTPAAATTVLSNVTGSSAAPAYNTVSAVLDTTLGNAQGYVPYRSATSWISLTPGTAGQVLTTGGVGANPSWTTITSSTGATPTQAIGLTAVAGSAATFIRSDGAPALSQAINPTWTGNHIFNGTVTVGSSSGSVQATSGLLSVISNTGTGNNVLATSPTLVTPILGTPQSVTLTNATGLPLSTGVTGTLPVANGGTGTTTSTGTGSVVLSASPTFTGTLTAANLTATGTTTLNTGLSGSLQAASGVVSAIANTGTGSNVLATSPVLVTPNLGTPSYGVLTSATGLPLSTGVTGTLPVANGGTGVTTSTGTTNVVLSTSPVLVTPNLGTPSFVTLTSGTGLPLTTGVTGTLPVANGGTGATTANAAQRSLTPATSTISASAIDWSLSNSFYKTLAANTTFTFSNAQDGQVITICLLNTTSNYTVTWPTIKWSGGTAPTMTTGAHYDVYTIYYNSTAAAYFGSYVQNF